jgi:hypothetical protein
MPLISHFYGILIYIYSEAGGQHNTPHFHAIYAEFSAVFDLDGNLIKGELPKNKSKMIEVWCNLHREELNAAWRAWNESGETVKIEGLR